MHGFCIATNYKWLLYYVNESPLVVLSWEVHTQNNPKHRNNDEIYEHTAKWINNAQNRRGHMCDSHTEVK